MRKTVVAVASTIVIFAASSPASAGDFYVYGSAGQSDIGLEKGNLDRFLSKGLTNAGATGLSSSSSVDNTDTGYKLGVGYQVTPISNVYSGADGCMIFSATVWHSAGRSEKVKEFYVCTYDINNSPYTQKMEDPAWKGSSHPQIGYFYNEYDKYKWQSWVRGGETKLANSGYKRTDGPLPPRFALDQDNLSQATWRAVSSGQISAYLMYAMRNMGYMINRDDMEGRFWIVDVSL